MYLPLQEAQGLLQPALLQVQRADPLLQIVDQVLLLYLALSRQILHLLLVIQKQYESYLGTLLLWRRCVLTELLSLGAHTCFSCFSWSKRLSSLFAICSSSCSIWQHPTNASRCVQYTSVSIIKGERTLPVMRGTPSDAPDQTTYLLLYNEVLFFLPLQGLR